MTFHGRLDLLVRRLRRAANPTADAASDASLLERFVTSHDEAAFELLLWRHGPTILAACRRILGCEQDAEDAFQAAFLLLARKAGAIRRREAVAGWLYRTACRIALRARQAARKRPVPMPAGIEPAAPDARPDLIWRDLRPVLDEEVHRLPAKYRLPIILCYLQGRTHAEAACELGCPKGTVSVRLLRARDLLRGRLTRRGLALSAAALGLLAAERTASAAVPAATVNATLKAALLFAEGKAVAGAVSARVLAWSQGVLKTMFLSKVKVAAVVLLTAAAATATGFLMSRSVAEPPKADPPAAANRAEDAKTAAPAPDEPEKPAPTGTAEVPSEREGRLVLVGTDVKPDEAVPEKDRVTVQVGFLAVEVGGNNDRNSGKIKPEKWWAELDPTGAKAYIRLAKGVQPGKVLIVREERQYRKLHVGDHVEAAQLLAIVDETPVLEEIADAKDSLEAAELACNTAIKTRDEAVHRASSAEFLWMKGKGYIGEDDYRAALLNRDRYVEEEKEKQAARRHAEHKLNLTLSRLEACEIRSSDRGVVKAILKRKGETVRNGEAVVRLEVPDAAGVDQTSVLPPVNVPAQRDGVLLVVGTDLKEGAKVPADQIITIKEGGQTKSYRRLSEGLVVEEGQLLARIDDRLARLDLDVAKSKLDAARAALSAALKTKEEADRRYQALTKLRAAAVVSEEDLSAAKLNADRCAGEQEVKQAELRQAETGLKTAETILEMYEIRSPVRGVVKAILKSRGEAVKSLETVVQIQEKAKD